MNLDVLQHVAPTELRNYFRHSFTNICPAGANENCNTILKSFKIHNTLLING